MECDFGQGEDGDGTPTLRMRVWRCYGWHLNWVQKAGLSGKWQWENWIHPWGKDKSNS